MSVDSSPPDLPVGFSVTVDPAGSTLPDMGILECSGELDLSTCDQLGAAVAGTSEGDLILDLTSVTFMDSSGIAVLVSSARELDEHGRRFVVVCPQGAPRRVLNLTGLEEMLGICDDREEAVAALKRLIRREHDRCDSDLRLDLVIAQHGEDRPIGQALDAGDQIVSDHPLVGASVGEHERGLALPDETALTLRQRVPQNGRDEVIGDIGAHLGRPASGVFAQQSDDQVGDLRVERGGGGAFRGADFGHLGSVSPPGPRGSNSAGSRW